ncbi:hypothetical protein ACQ4PT_055542 [Festuca glaucescens]
MIAKLHQRKGRRCTAGEADAVSCYLGDSLLLVRKMGKARRRGEAVREVEEETMDEHRSAPTEVKYIQSAIIMLENVVGWYHSHPGYGCWLSDIDVSTQMLNQHYIEPFLAVVIDPTRTVSAVKWKLELLGHTQNITSHRTRQCPSIRRYHSTR